MEVKKINGMDVLDLCHCSQKQIKELKKFTNLDEMNESELEKEFWEIQSKFDRMSQDQAESEEGLLLSLRQSFLNSRHEELTGKAILG